MRGRPDRDGRGRGHNLSVTRLPYKWLVAAVFVGAVFMDLLDTSSVNVALPTLARGNSMPA